MSFKKYMQHSPVVAHFFLVEHPKNHWSVYLEDALENKKFLFSKWTPNIKVVEKDLNNWASSNNYDSFKYRIKSGTN